MLYALGIEAIHLWGNLIMVFNNSSIDERFILELLREICRRSNELPPYSRDIWLEQSQTQENKTIDYLNYMIDRGIIEGMQSYKIACIGEKPNVQIDNIAWRGEEFLRNHQGTSLSQMEGLEQGGIEGQGLQTDPNPG